MAFFRFLTLTIFSIFLSVSYGQENRFSFPDGFHISIIGEGNIAQKISVIPLGKNYPPPRAFTAFGWKSGLEFSYHFANHFGVSVGVNYGTVAQFRLYVLEEAGYNPLGLSRGQTSVLRLQIPAKLEFHFPIFNSKNYFFVGSVGANVENIPERIITEIIGENVFNEYYYFGGHFQTDPYCHYLEYTNGNKIQFSLLMSLGIYYKLPYNDLIRIAMNVNYSFNDKFHGNYRYLLVEDAYGALSYRHNHIGFELAYIHCFKKKIKKKEEKKGNQENNTFINKL